MEWQPDTPAERFCKNELSPGLEGEVELVETKFRRDKQLVNLRAALKYRWAIKLNWKLRKLNRRLQNYLEKIDDKKED